jgi:hypothetical protein
LLAYRSSRILYNNNNNSNNNNITPPSPLPPLCDELQLNVTEAHIKYNDIFLTSPSLLMIFLAFTTTTV